ncbi:MAG: DUF1353 domain-containing protein [Acidimicrobiia bacterium]|nr:DUF1353 domain-containing protein [Acidimicrobiia bacterium]
MPFHAIDADGQPAGEADFVIAQLDAKRFRLVEPFRYVGPPGAWTVESADLPDTDLTSVPRFLRWFIGVTGQHMPAALLHDHLVGNGTHESPPVSRAAADDVFLHVLGELRVPQLRRLIMWAAVVLATKLGKPRGADFVGVVVWALAGLVGTIALVVSLAAGELGWAVVAAIAPVPFAALWGRCWRAGIVAGFGVLIVALPSIAILVGFIIYAVLEWLLRQLQALRPSVERSEVPQPTRYREL